MDLGSFKNDVIYKLLAHKSYIYIYIWTQFGIKNLQGLIGVKTQPKQNEAF